MALTQDAIDAALTVKDLVEAVHADFEVWTQIEGELGGAAEDVADIAHLKLLILNPVPWRSCRIPLMRSSL